MSGLATKDRDSSQLEGRVRLHELQHLLVRLLGHCDVSEVIEADGLHATQCVSDNVVLAADMPDVGRELADVVQVPYRLFRCVMVRTNEGKGERLVVREDDKVPALDLRPEVLDGLLDGQQLS